MRRVLKHHVTNLNSCKITTLAGPRFLHAGPDPHGALCVWCEEFGEDGSVTEDHWITIVGTGNELSDDPGNFLGTVLFGRLMLHMYSPTLKRIA